MACINKEEQGKLYQSIARYIAAQEDLNSYSHITHMNDLFDKFVKAGKTPATALSYIQLMPRYIQEYLLRSKKNNLVKDDVLMALSILPKKFELGTLENVAKELGLTSEKEVEETIEINVDEIVSPKDKTQKIFQAKSNDPNSTTGPDERVDSTTQKVDPKKTWYHGFNRALLNNLTGYDGSTITVKNHTGFKLTAIKMSEIPFEELYDFLKEGDFSEEEIKRRLDEDEIVALVITDNDGKILKFNNDYSVNPEGKMVYFQMRDTRFDLLDNNIARGRIQSVEEIAKNQDISEDEAMRKVLNGVANLKAIQKGVFENKKIVLDITGGTPGYFPVFEKGKTLSYETTPSTLGQITADMPFFKINYDTLGNKANRYITLFGSTINLFTRKLNDTELKDFSKASVDSIYTSDNINVAFEFLAQHLALSSSYKNDLEKLLESFINNGSKEENTERLIEFLKTGGTSKTGFWLTYQKEAPSYYGIKNGKLAIVNREEHYNFWKEVLRTPVPLNDDGRVQLFNSYLNFEIDPDTKKELGLEKRAELPSKKPSAIDKIIRNIDPESLMKVKGMSSEASEKQIQAALDWYNSDENEYLRSVVPFEPMFEIINSNAKAVWSRTGIILYHGSNYTDLYHEAWHGFSQLFLTEKEKNDLYREVGKMSGTFSLPGGGRIKFSDAKPVQIEEYLAEEFRQYKLSNGTKVFGQRPVTNGIFAKILKFLNWLFDNVSYEQTQIDFNSLQKVKLLYDNLSGGKILDKKPNAANIMFGSLASPIGDAKKGNQLTIAQSNEVSDSMDAILSDILENFSKEKGRVLIGEFLSSSQSIKNLYTNIKQIIEEKIVDLSTDVEKNEYALSVLQTAIDDFGDIDDTIDNKILNDSTTISYHLRRSKLLDFKTKTLDDNDEKNFSLDTNVQNDLQQNGEVSFEDMANEKVLFLIRTLKQYDSNGEVEMNDLGFPKLTKFNKTLGTLIRNLNNNSGVMSIKRTLEEMSSNGAFEIAELLSKLGNINIGEDVQNKEVLNAWILFANSFNTTSLPLIITRLEQKSDYENLEFGYTLYNTQGKLDLSNTKRKFAQEFAFDRLNTITTKDPSGARVIDKQKLIDRFDDAFGDKYNKASDKAKFNTAVEFYKAIGIPVGKSEEYKELLTNTTVLVGAKFVYKMLLAYTDKGKSTNFIPDHINYLTNTKGENQSNVINTVIESYLKVEDIVSTFSLLNAEGNRQYENILNNTITITKNGINEVNNFVDFYNKPEFAHYNPTRNPMVRHSQMFKKLFGDTLGSRIDTLNLSNFSGIQLDKDGINVTSVSILDTDPTTKFFIDMYSYINNGYIEVPRHADKKMALAFHTGNNPHFINPLEYLQDVPSADDKFVDIMFGYLTAEHERVQDIRNNTISDLDFFPEFKNQGKEFLIFHDILTTEQKNMLYDMSIEDFANLSKDSELYKSLQQQISSYLTFLTSQNKEVYDEMKYLDQDSIRKLVKPAAGKLKISDTEKADRLVRAYSANAFVSFVESTILFYGDISAYNLLKEEFHKRNSSAGSTGRTFMSDKEIIGGYNELFGNKYASKRGYKSYGIDKDGIVRTAVFNDIQVQNDKLIAEYADNFKEKYTKDFTAFGLKGKALTDRVEEEVAKSIKKYFADEIKEGDGQGWLTFDAYRMLAKLSNEWSQSQEDLYLKIIEGKEIGIDEVMKYFPPRKYQYYGPIKTDKYHLNALHKFSLMPLIPKVIKGKNLELLHERMMNDNVHYATFKSGSKTATRTYADGKSDNLYSDLATRTAMPIDAPFIVNEINIKFLRNQVSINDEFKGEVVFSTQMRKLIINELFEKGVPLTPNVERLVKSYLKNIEKYIDFNKQELRDEIELKKDGKFNAESLAKIIKKEMSRRDFPEHLQDAVTKIENGKFAYDLSYALNAEDIEAILLSVVNKRIVRRKVNGEPLVQAAVSGFELQRMKGVSEEEAKKYGYDELEFYRKDPVTGKTLPMQVKIALQGQFKKLLYLKHNGKVIGDRESLNLALKDPKWMKEYGAMVRLTGVRIPVQGFNSMEMMEVAEFLDESAGNIVVPPTQIVSKSGGDFDIDKLSIFFPNIFLSKDKSVVKLDTVGNAGLENNITQDIINILSAPEIAAALIRPNDTDLVQPLSKEMLKYFAKSYNPKKNFNQDPESMKFIDDLETDPAKKVKTRSVSPTKIFETRYNIYKQFSNSVGKKALGIGAVDNAYNALFNQVGLYLNDTFEHSRTDKKTGKLVYQTRKNRLLLNHNKMASGNISLSNIFNKEGTKISDLINQLINGWVDVAKDPWIAYVMGTPEASPSLLYLVQAGVPFKQAVYFLANPLVREYFDTLKKMNSPLAALSQTLEQNSKGGFDTISSLPENEFKLKTRMLGLDQYTTGHKLYDEIIDLTKGIENITEKELKDRLEASLDPTWERNETDMAVFAHFLEILDVANGLFKIKSALNFDTKTSTTMYDAYARTVKKDSIIEEDEDEANVLKIFPKDKLKALYNDTILKNFDVSEMQMEMFGDMFKVRNHPNLNKYLLNFYKNSLVFGSNIYDRVKEIFNGNDKLISEFKNDFTTAITLTALRDFNPKTGVYKGYQIVDVNSKEYDRVVNKKATKSLPTDKLHFAKNNYTKQTAEDYPKYGFIFTENAEKLGTNFNVSRSQAVIRTNQQGERNPNALAIVTKKMQKVGANFTNSEADFTQFKELNTELINNIVNSKFERIIVPTGGFAMEKAKLPTRFAEWLQNELQTKLGIATELVDRGEGLSGLTNSKKYEEPTTQQSANPLVEAGIKPTDMSGNAAKDIQMASESTQFIGFGTVMKEGNVSSTDKYARAWGDKANTGEYTANDTIMVSGSGNFGRGGVDKTEEAAAIKKTLSEKYKPLLNKAIEAGASFRIGNQYSKGNLSDETVAKYLEQKGYTEEKLNGYSRWIAPVAPKGEKFKDGIYINQEGLSKEEELELFELIRPVLEEQAVKSNSGKNAPKMAGLGLNWDYLNGVTKRRDNGFEKVDIQDPLRKNTAYGWFTSSSTGEKLGSISKRMVELMTKATGIDVTDYDGSIINIYNSDSFIGNHPDIDESKTAEKYPVVVVNIGGPGNIVLGSDKVNLKSGAGYVFGVDGKNRTISHSTYASPIKGTLPSITTQMDGETLAAGSYRVSITMRRVMPLEKGMPESPKVISEIASTNVKEGTLLNKVGDTIVQSSKTKYKIVNLNGVIEDITETENGYNVTLRFKSYNGSKTEKVIIENGNVIKTVYKSPLKMGEFIESEKSSYNFEFSKQTIQPPTSVTEFDIADSLTPIEQNLTDGQGSRQMQSQFKDKSTMDLIISGDRTRTTRAKTDIQRMVKDYNLSKISDLVGKVIRMTDNTGRQVYTRITKVAPFTQEYQDATWEKEGWEKSVTDKNVGNYPYAIEFEVVNKPTQPIEVEQIPTKGTNIPGYIPTGVFVQDGKMYVDMEILSEQFKNGDYSNNNTGAYSILVKTAEDTSYTLTKMSPKTFNNNFSEYVHFVMEREYQRSVLKATDITNFDKILSNIIRTKKEFLLTATNKKLKMDIGENKKINDTVGTFELNKYGLVDFIDASTGEILYENLKKVKGNEYQEYVLNKDVLLALQLKVVEDHITNKALKNILNSYSYMEDPNNGYAIQLMNMLRDPAYSYLKKDYTILDALTTSHSKESGITNLVFKEGKPDADTITNYNDELNRLANIDVIKNDDIHVNKAISEFFEKFQYYVLLSSGFSSNTKYSLNSIISQEKILSFTNNKKIEQATNRILNNPDYSVVERNINTFTEKFLKNRLGLVRAGGTEKFSKKPGFTTDSSNRNKQYVAQGVSEPVTRYENVIPSDNTLKKVNDFLYYIDIDLIRIQASGSKDPKYFTNTLLKLAETHDDKLFIFTSGDKIPVTVKASNISTFNSPEQIKNAEFSGPVIIPVSGLKGMNDAGTALLSEALFEKFNVRNPGFDKGSSKLTIREMMNSDSFLTSMDVINSIRIKSHAILDELNSCNF